MSNGIAQELIDRLENNPGMTRVFVNNSVDNTLQSAYAADPAVQAMAEQYLENPLRLQGDKMPNDIRVGIKPLHRLMVYLHASGQTAKQIALHMDVHYQTVVQILRQPWARNMLVEMLDELGRDKVKHFLETEVAPCLEVLRDVRDDPRAKNAEKIAAANALLDRALGKPTVHVESDNTNRTVPADITRLDQEIAAVRKQLDSKGVPNDQN